jgi:inner membrane protein involved in colicin E2 resistance
MTSEAPPFYLVGEGNLSEVQLDQAITPDGRRADVTLSSLWSPPVVSDFLPSMVRLSVTAHSQVFIQ